MIRETKNEGKSQWIDSGRLKKKLNESGRRHLCGWINGVVREIEQVRD